MNLLMPMTLFFIIYSFKRFINKELFILTFIFVNVFILSVVYSFFYGLNFTSSTYFFHIIVVILCLNYCCSLNISTELILSFLFQVSILMFLICLYQFLLGLGLVISLPFVTTREVYEGLYIVIGGVGNPNNQSTLSILLVLLSLFIVPSKKNGRSIETKSNLKKIVLIYFSNLIIILMTLSRTVLVLYLLVTFLFYLQLNSKGRFLVLLIFSLFMFLGFTYMASLDSSFLSRIFDRFISILLFFDGADDSSVGVRSQAYIYVLNNLDSSIMGFGPNNFEDFFKNAEFYDSNVYLSESPHSFIFEMLLTFGIFGYLFLTVLFSLMIRSIFLGDYKILLFYCCFAIVSFVPSSIMKMPSIFLLLFIPLLYSNGKQAYENRSKLF
ncbi:hypothetical protein AN944_00685 [Shewanella sp. P1-14-1]|nr:hypothetical protein AN944_00685 [Shewanella sp. P1-14-1]